VEEDTSGFAAACRRAEDAALRLIARAEQNTAGLAAKLERRSFDAAVIQAVVSGLVDRDLLNDARYAERWIRSRLALRKAPSPWWLLTALRKRGIDREPSRKALDKALDPQTEYELLVRYAQEACLSQGKAALPHRAWLRHQGFSSQALDRYFDEASG